MPESTSNTRTSLRERVSALRTADQRALRRKLREAREADGPARAAAFAALETDVEAKEQALKARAARLPKIVYPEELPVSQRREDLLEAIRDNQVVIIAGETGSGKTTQIPKICLELGRGVRGMIGHTQPRRIAARAVAERIAEELGSPLGEAVGWKVRFTDQVSDASFIKVMTDGILLTEIQRDRLLSAYDTIIIDEAHERSLNIDFILGCLRQILSKRPDLKVIVTSATIDPERFAKHFAGSEKGLSAGGEKKGLSAGGEKQGQSGTDGDPAPIIEVSGRTYPVEVRYRPLLEDEVQRDQTDGILEAVSELGRVGDGDILVFLSGEQEIRDTADALEKAKLRHTEIVPLYARLSAAEQHRVFSSHTGRRIVLATNVAETSLTVPGIRYVIDAGNARISRYSARTKVQRLPIERISQASANQRAGRCGRVAEGVCIRLYSEEDYLSRPEFTDAEILRTNLASVILQMTAAKLGKVESFPFVDAPDQRNIKDGTDLLVEIGALEDIRSGERRLTQTGRDLARLPIDPRLARMILQAREEGCVYEVAVITAALSIQDPRERPADKKAQSDQAHARFNDPESDFSAYLNLWKYLDDERRSRSSSAFRRMCKQEYLHYLRIREWQDLVRQILSVLKSLKIPTHPTNPAPDTKRIHTALLSGLLSHIGVKEADKREYLGGRNAKFAIFPGSGLFKKQPRWVVAGELVETSRLWGRVCAKIEPEWVEPLAEHLTKRTYSEPHWSKKSGAVLAFERVTLYGVPIVPRRQVNFGRIDPAASRELFIRHALVQGEWETHHAFFQRNRDKIGEVEDLENRVRQRGLLADEQTLFDFYDERLPADIVSGRHFDSWWKKQPDKHRLDFDEALLLGDRAGDVAAEHYPEVWTSEGVDLELDYEFEPGKANDGVTVGVPLPALQQLDQDAFTWQVPGLRAEFAESLLKSLPKSLRRNFVPAPDFARAAVARMSPEDGRPMTAALAETLRTMTGVHVPEDAFDLTKIPGHLLITFQIKDEDGSVLAQGKELGALQRQLAPKAAEAASEAAPELERTGLTTWDFGDLPKLQETPRRGYTAKAYPALVDEGTTVGIKAFPDPASQAAGMWAGTRRLIRLNVPDPHLKEALTRNEQLALATGPYDNVGALLDDCIRTVLDKVLIEGGGTAWDQAGFEALLKRARPEVAGESAAVARKAAAILTEARAASRLLEGKFDFSMLPAMSDMRAQLDGLVGNDGFIGATGWWRLDDLHRYLKGIVYRAKRVVTDPAGDKAKMDLVRGLEAERDSLARTRPTALRSGEGRELRWMLEELRISFFAQQLGTRYQVSEKRVRRLLQSL
ncbi:ATP-dependent RNA helicase HrpA [Glycomyces buryatensis]|uniref:RNA helicase n=1 Tax=Glycomyces buryatensis TaxID=2570927 RepID=A0A4S8Q9K2_9ACTN|nr:ATP-dependent RNA helicase HrpA [Glycomyces buryatensis]THV39462.1 ATP-dependent RNA helicase HrpA [Glycomyces buryatensis]